MREREEPRKTKAAVCTETRRAKDEYDVLYGKPTPVLEFLELEFNGNTNTDRPALRSSVDSGVALMHDCLRVKLSPVCSFLFGYYF